MYEWTFVMVKPDAIERGLIGRIISRFEDKGLRLVGMKMVWPTKELVEEHYADLKDKPHYPQLIDFMTSGPVIPMVWEGPNAITIGRVLIGVKDPVLSTPGSIRGDYASEMPMTVIHGARTPEDAETELKLWFNSPADRFIWEDILGSESFDTPEVDAKYDKSVTSEKGEENGPQSEGVQPAGPSEAIHPIDPMKRAA